MINFLFGVAVATGLFLFNLPFLIHRIIKEKEEDEKGSDGIENEKLNP